MVRKHGLVQFNVQIAFRGISKNVDLKSVGLGWELRFCISSKLSVKQVILLVAQFFTTADSEQL